MPNNETISSTEKGELPLAKSLTKQARLANILPKLGSASLISLGQLCDDDCNVLLTKKTLLVIKNKEIVLQGIRNKCDGFWDIPVSKRTMSPTNYKLPPTHPGIYPSTAPTHNMAKYSFSPRYSTVKNTIPKHMRLMNDLIGDNIFQHTLDTQFNEDIKNTQRVALIHDNPSLSVIIQKKKTHMELVQYLHAACFSPVKSTFIKAIKNNHFGTWPGLTAELVSKYLPKVIATTQGHLHQERQKLQSTSKSSSPSTIELTKIKKKLDDLKKKQKPGQSLEEVLQLELDNDNFPPAAVPNVCTNEVAYIIIKKDDVCTAYTDLTGRFPLKSSRGNEYILVAYHYDANCIYGIPIKNRKATSITEAWRQMHAIFQRAGVAPTTYVLDNETSTDFEAALSEESTTFQLVPPHTHRRNLAERAIQTWKNHFKAGLASVDPNFPLSEWDRLIDQTNITLNLLRSARTNSKLSAYAYIFGEFNFAATPLAPPGTKIVAHIKSSQRRTWELNGESGWYVGPAMKHYRCVTCYFPRTKAERACDTVTFFPTTVPFPEVRLQDFLRQAASDIITLLTHPPSTTTPTLQAGDPVRNALLTLADQLQRVEHIPASIVKPSQLPTPTTYQLHPPNISKSTVSPPRVQKIVAAVNPPPRVSEPLTKTTIPTSVLQQHAKTTKNVRYLQTPTHRYNLRSTTKNYGDNFKHKAADYLLAQHLWQHNANHIYRTDGTKHTIDSLLKGPDRLVWDQSLSNEWGRLAQGNKYGVRSTNTIDFIHQHEVPSSSAVTYATYVLDHRPLKTEPYRVRITVGGDKLNYDLDAGSPAANLIETKLLINSTISHAKQGARFMTTDIKDYFLASPMENPEYMKVHLRHIPQDIRLKYKINEKDTPNGFVYIRIKKGCMASNKPLYLHISN